MKGFTSYRGQRGSEDTSLGAILLTIPQLLQGKGISPEETYAGELVGASGWVWVSKREKNVLAEESFPCTKAGTAGMGGSHDGSHREAIWALDRRRSANQIDHSYI
jgi:hypothetical protein